MVSVASARTSTPPLPLAWARTFALIVPACTLLILHMSLRGSAWRREWLLATDLVAFSWVLTGPIVAGSSCVLGAQLSRGAVFFRTSERGTKAIVAEMTAVVLVIVAVYVVTYTGVAVYVWSGPVDNVPTLRDLASALPLLMALASMVAVGMLVGWRARSPLWAPVVAVAAFAAILIAYSAVPGAFVQFGGATSTLIGLRPRLPQQLCQVWFYASVLSAAMLVLTRSVVPSSGRRRAALVLAAVSATVSGAILWSSGGSRFEPAEVAVECGGTDITLCLADGYSDLRDSLHPQLAAAIGALRSAGLDVPMAVTQDPQNTAALQLPATNGLGSTEVVAMVTGYFLEPSCDVFVSEQVYQAYVDVAYWLAATLGVTQYDPSVSSELGDVTSEAAAQLVRQQISVLRSCA